MRYHHTRAKLVSDAQAIRRPNVCANRFGCYRDAHWMPRGHLRIIKPSVRTDSPGLANNTGNSRVFAEATELGLRVGFCNRLVINYALEPTGFESPWGRQIKPLIYERLKFFSGTVLPVRGSDSEGGCKARLPEFVAILGFCPPNNESGAIHVQQVDTVMDTASATRLVVPDGRLTACAVCFVEEPVRWKPGRRSFARSGDRCRMKILIGGPVSTCPWSRIASHARAVPRVLGLIPRNNARGADTRRSTPEALPSCRDTRQPSSDHDARLRRFHGNEFVFLQVPRGQPIDVLRGRVDRFSSEVCSCSPGHTAGLYRPVPRVLPAWIRSVIRSPAIVVHYPGTRVAGDP